MKKVPAALLTIGFSLTVQSAAAPLVSTWVVDNSTPTVEWYDANNWSTKPNIPKNAQDTAVFYNLPASASADWNVNILDSPPSTTSVGTLILQMSNNFIFSSSGPQTLKFDNLGALNQATVPSSTGSANFRGAVFKIDHYNLPGDPTLINTYSLSLPINLADNLLVWKTTDNVCNNSNCGQIKQVDFNSVISETTPKKSLIYRSVGTNNPFNINGVTNTYTGGTTVDNALVRSVNTEGAFPIGSILNVINGGKVVFDTKGAVSPGLMLFVDPASVIQQTNSAEIWLQSLMGSGTIQLDTTGAMHLGGTSFFNFSGKFTGGGLSDSPSDTGSRLSIEGIGGTVSGDNAGFVGRIFVGPISTLTVSSVKSLGADSPTGSPVFVRNGGTLNLPWGTLNKSLVLNGPTALNATNGAITLTQNIQLGWSGGSEAAAVDVGINGSSPITISGMMSGSKGFTKSGTGNLTLNGSSSNTFNGDVTLTQGTLSLAKSGGAIAIPQNLTVSNALVSYLASDQIANTSTVSISSGTISLGTFSNTINNLIFKGGSITGTGTLNLAATSGDALTVGTGTSVTLPIKLTGCGGALHFIDSPTLSAIDLGQTGCTSQRPIIVDTGYSAAIGTSTSTSGFEMKGPGILNLSTPGPHTHAPSLLSGGTLYLGSPYKGNLINQSNLQITATMTGDLTQNGGITSLVNSVGTAITGNLTVNNGSLFYYAANQMSPNSTLSLLGGSTNFNNFNTTVNSLIFTGGVVSNIGTLSLAGSNTTALTLGSQTLGGNIKLTGCGATVSFTGAGTINNLDFGSCSTNQTISVATTGTIFNSTGTSGFNMQGPGTLVLTGTNTPGNSTISGGTLNLNGSFANNLSITGGTLALGASDRISNSATLTMSGGTFAMGAFNETINNLIFTGGAITGTGTLSLAATTGDVLSIGGDSTFSAPVALTGCGSAVRFTGPGSISSLNLGSCNRPIFVNSTGTIAVATGTSGFTFQGPGTLTLSGTNNPGNSTISAGILNLNGSFANNLSITGGTLALGASERISNSATLTMSGGTFAMGTFNETINNLVFTGGSITGTGTLSLAATTGDVLSIGGGSTFSTPVALTGCGSAVRFTGPGSISSLNLGSCNRPIFVNSTGTIGVVTGTSGFAFQGPGTLTLTGESSPGNSTISAGTLNLNGRFGHNLSITGGTVKLGDNNLIADSANVTVNGGTLDFAGFSDAFNNLTFTTGSIVNLDTLSLTATSGDALTIGKAGSNPIDGFPLNGSIKLTGCGSSLNFVGPSTIFTSIDLGNCGTKRVIKVSTSGSIYATTGVDGFDMQGPGALTLSRNSHTVGDSQVSAGTLHMNSTFTGNLLNNAIFNQNGNFLGTITNTATLNQSNVVSGTIINKSGTTTNWGMIIGTLTTEGGTSHNNAMVTGTVNSVGGVTNLNNQNTYPYCHSINGKLVVSGGTVNYKNEQQVIDTGMISISGGTINFGNFDETVATLSYTGGSLTNLKTLSLGATSGDALLLGGGVTFSGFAQITGCGSAVHFTGPATISNIDLGSCTVKRPIIVDSGITGTINASTGTNGFEKQGLGTLILSSGSHASGDSSITLGALTLNSTLAGNFTANGGTTTLNSVTNAMTGNLTINSGTVVYSAANQIADTSMISVLGGTLNLSTFNETVNSLVFNGGTITGTGLLTLSALTMGNASLVVPTKLQGCAGIRYTGPAGTANITNIDLGSCSSTTPIVIDDGTSTLIIQKSTSIGGFELKGPGTVALSGAGPHTHGPSIVSGGSLSLLSPLTSALSIKGGAVVLGANNVLSQTLSISGGTFDVGNFNTTLNNLIFTGGEIKGTGALSLSATNGDILTVGANVNFSTPVVLAGCGSNVRFMGPSSISSLNLGPCARPILVETVGTLDSSTGTKGFDFQGPGTLTLKGLQSPGSSTVSKGTLVLNGTFSSDLTINGGKVEYAAGDQISDTATLTINSGTLDLKSFNETLKSFVFNGGTVLGTGNLFLEDLSIGDASLIVPTTLTACGILTHNTKGSALIADINLGSCNTPIIVNKTGTLTIGKARGSLTMQGPGNLALSGPFTGDLALTGGVLDFSNINQIVNSFAFTGGSVTNVGELTFSTLSIGNVTLSGLAKPLKNASISIDGGTIENIEFGFPTPISIKSTGTIKKASGSFDIQGPGTLTLLSATGPTQLSGGTLALGANLALSGDLHMSGGAFDLATYTTTLNSLTCNGGALLGNGLILSAPAGSDALILGSSLAANVSLNGGGNIHFTAPSTLSSVDVTYSTPVIVDTTGKIGSSTGSGTLLMQGPGTLSITGTLDTDFTSIGGQTLLSTIGISIGKNLNIQGGSLTYSAADQTNHNSMISVSGGTLDFGKFNQTINSLTFTGGSVTNVGQLTFSNLSLGNVSIGGVLKPTCGASISLDGSTIENIDFGKCSQPLTVKSTATILSSCGTAGFNMQGPGTLTLTGDQSPGDSTVSSGSLILNSTFKNHLTINGGLTILSSLSGNAIGGNLTLNNGEVNYGKGNQIGDSSTLTINNGTLNLLTFDETLKDFVFNGGSVMGTGNLFLNDLTMGDASLIVPTTFISCGSLNHPTSGAAFIADINLGKCNIPVTVDQAGTLTINKAKGDLTMQGPGTLALSGPFTGNLGLAGGVLDFSNIDQTVNAFIFTGGEMANVGTLTFSSLILGNATTSGLLKPTCEAKILLDGGTIRNIDFGSCTAALSVKSTGTISNSRGSAGFDMQGPGTLTLTGAQFPGDSVVSGGTLALTGTLGSNLSVTGGSALWNSSDRLSGSLSITGGTSDFNAFSDTIPSLLFTGGSIANLGTLTLTATSGNLLTVGNNVSIPGSIVLAGCGSAVYFNSPATLTQIDWGTCQRNILVDTSGTVVNSTNDFNLKGPGDLSLTGSSTGNGLVSGGTLLLSGTQFSGNLLINGGTVKYLKDDQLSDKTTLTLQSGALDLNNKSDSIQTFNFIGGTFSRGSGSLHLSATKSEALILGNVKMPGLTTLTGCAGAVRADGNAVIENITFGTKPCGHQHPLITTNASTLQINGSSGADGFDVQGTVTFTGPGFHKNAPSSVSSGTLKIDASYSGSIEVAPKASLYIETSTLLRELSSGPDVTNNGFTCISGNASSVTNYGTLAGTGTISGDFVNHGILTPGACGGSLGALSVGGNATFKSDSTYRLDISPNETVTADLLAVSGTCTIEPGAKLLVLPASHGDFPPTFSVNIITASNLGANQTYDVNCPNPLFQFTVEYPEGHLLKGLLGDSASSVKIVRTLPSVNALSGCAINDPMAQVLASDLLLFNPIINDLILLQCDEIASAAAKMNPSFTKALPTIQSENSATIRSTITHRQDSLTSRACDKPCTNKMAIWVDVDGSHLHQRSDIGYRANSGLITAGLDKQTHCDLSVGLAASYSHSSVDWQEERGNGEIESGYLNLYASKIWDKVFLNAIIGGEYNNFSYHRHLHFSNTSKKIEGKFDGHTLNASIYTGLSRRSKGFELRPLVGIEYISQMNTRYSETDGGNYNLSFEQSRHRMMRFEGGINLSKCLDALTIDWKLSYIREQRFGAKSYNLKWITFDKEFSLCAPKRSVHLGDSGLFATYTKDQKYIRAGYEVRVGSHFIHHIGSIAAGLNF